MAALELPRKPGPSELAPDLRSPLHRGPPGLTKSVKSLMPVGVCRLFGLTYRHMRKIVPKETEKSMWGRRTQVSGGA